MIGVESYIMLGVAALFTLLYFLADEKAKKFWGTFTAVSWIFLGILWLFLAQEPMPNSSTTYATHVFALFFVGIGILFLILVVVRWMGLLEKEDPWSLP